MLISTQQPRARVARKPIISTEVDEALLADPGLTAWGVADRQRIRGVGIREGLVTRLNVRGKESIVDVKAICSIHIGA